MVINHFLHFPGEMIILICRYNFVQVLTKSTCKEGKVEFYGCFSFFMITKISFLVFQAEAAFVFLFGQCKYRSYIKVVWFSVAVVGPSWVKGKLLQAPLQRPLARGAGTTGAVQWTVFAVQSKTLLSSLEQRSSQEKFLPKFRRLN